MEKVEIYESYGFYSPSILQNFYFKFFVFIVSFLILALIIFLLFRYLRVKKEKELMPWDWAFLQLNKLDISKCVTKNDFKKFYFDLTMIVKSYLLKRYFWDVLNKTDEELIVFLKKKSFDSNLLEGLEKIFEDAVFIKFADQDALRPKAEKDLGIVKKLVKSTKLKG